METDEEMGVEMEMDVIEINHKFKKKERVPKLVLFLFFIKENTKHFRRNYLIPTFEAIAN